ncbi:MAG: thioredoxin [Oscillospiraceae bacterium]|jgi:thioredoxin 1|nr:thioredoxin [Oscillospiraceae bacterium]
MEHVKYEHCKKGSVVMELVEITTENYEQEVANFEGLVLLDFWAEWCNPCKVLMPVIEEVAREVNEIKFGKVNVDKNEKLANQFAVTNIPFLVVLKNGEVQNSSVGMKSKQMILEMLNV